MKINHLTLYKLLIFWIITALWPSATAAQEIMLTEPKTEAVEENSPKEEAQEVQYERILSFHTDIRIDTSGMMHLTEKIQVYANGNQIKRGLVRRIPIYRKDIFGDRKPADFKITGILKDGKKENYKTKNDGSVRSIYIGDEDVILSPGLYTYEISYETKGQIGFFKNYDEIYWNVTGSDWDFNIEQASATITFPQGASPGQTACYTGAKGSTGKDCEFSVNADQTLTFKTKDYLPSGTGFTIAAAFTKGIIHRPSNFELFYQDYLKITLSLLLLIGLGTYYYITWSRYGRDPKQPVTIPTFNIPNNWSPALLRYFYKKTIDDKSFAISVINMAVKKVVKIRKGIGKKEDYAVEKSTAATGLLSKEEEAIYTRFLGKKDRIYINKANGPTINAAKNAHRDRLKPQLDLKDFFVSHRNHLIKSAGMTAGVFVIFMIFVETGTPLMMLFFSPFIVIGGVCFVMGIKNIRKSIAAGIFLMIWGAGFGGIPLGMLILNLSHLPIVSLVFVMSSTVMFCLYVFLIKAPTVAGTELISKIKGFRMYLETAEEHRLNLLNPPEHTPELFEKFLPYALALDVENAWGAKFEELLNDADYSPDWYDGDRFNHKNISRGFIVPFSSAVSDSKPDTGSSSGSSGSSSWSSGSSGGGSSGGGGGGGGGGGW
ncbi:hypothetical protein PBAL39_00060 [Pedobacter sp. BAL39]|uniref:DUF2207 domain-containing protein n=1 Tax=Pedobacter sp. BAL39 TaxID=391596 RepID=UPI0001559D6C|nr:DUF2207 domain-containing protein [Pedobacter sp. BAL39]EDM34878.1 hypothetical protein PBAL39_00060 [Pedobacter sp. BAL39]